MSRLEEIREEVEKLYEERFRKTCEVIQRELEDCWEELEKDIEKVLKELVMKADVMQKEGAKGEKKYLVISHLYSSFLAETYEYRMDILDKEMYMDMQEVCSYWTPYFLIPHIKKDYEYFEKNMKGKFIRLREYEIKEVERGYQFYYHSLIYEIFSCLKKRIPMLADFKVLFGEYMGKAYLV